MRKEMDLESDDDIDRVVMWKTAHIPKDGNLDENLKPVVEKIDDLLEKKKSGDLIIEGSHDVLTQALGNPEHSGRVRGVGGFVTPSNYFGLPKQRRIAITKADLLARYKENERELQDTKKLLSEQEVKTQQMISQAIAEFESRMMLGQGHRNSPVTPLSDKGSHQDMSTSWTPSDKHLHNAKEDDVIAFPPPSDKRECLCDLALDAITNIVAFGTIVEGEGNDTVHDLPLPEGCVKVTVVGGLNGDAQLPFPVPQVRMLLVKDTNGNHVAWPEKWVIRKPGKAKKRSKVDKKLFSKTELPINVPKSCKLLYNYAKVTMKENDLSILTVLNDDVFGVPKQLVIVRENVMNLLEMDWIGSGAIEAYMAYLYEYLQEKNEWDMYGFVDPGATYDPTDPTFVPYLVERLKQGKPDLLIMIPHNPGNHWILTIIMEGEIYIMDSLPRPKPVKPWEKAVKSALKQYDDDTGKGNGKMPKVTRLLGAPMQPGGYECGYYVMRFMREIIYAETPSLDKWSATTYRKPYTQMELNEVRIELAGFIQSLT